MNTQASDLDRTLGGPSPEALPRFSAIDPGRVEAAVKAVLAENRETIDRLAGQRNPDWASLVEPLFDLDDALHAVWAPVSHLNSVRDTPQLRDAYNACLPLLSDYATELGQNAELFEAFRQVQSAGASRDLSPAAHRSLDNALRDFRLSGVALPDAAREEFRSIATRLSGLQARFEQNLLDATWAWHYTVADAGRLAGLPEADVHRAATRAEEAGEQGWRFNLDFPTYHAVMSHAQDRDLRETLYHAFVTRASEVGPNAGDYDNAEAMREIVALRQQQATLLGYADFAEYALETRMARSPREVFDFLKALVAHIKPRAEAELEELRRFARDRLGIEELAAWDMAYAAEQLRRERFSLSQEDLKPYFPAVKVRAGLFQLVGRLYGLELEPVDGVDTWHPDVEFFRLRDAAGTTIGYLYTDLYARPGKRSGAWMDECLTRRRLPDDGVRLPVAYLVCNFAPPAGGKPALLSHDDVLTLFHEFGHCLHHLLTRVDVPDVAGINGVAWDAVEQPSQFHEHFAWQREVLDMISGHVDSGEPLPEVLFERMNAARTFHSSLFLLRQLEFALYDFRLHATPGADPQETLNAVRTEVAVVPTPDYNRFANSFAHIFAGGYAAGYYSYLWAEVLASDAFSAFEEEGIFNPETATRFRETILAQGGSRDALDLFVAFRGREPEQAAFLRHHGVDE